MILIITRRDDLTADYLIVRLRQRGVPYLRFDVDHFLRDTTVTARFAVGKMDGEVRTPQGTAAFGDIQAVWYRRAMAPDLGQMGMTPADRWFAEREARHLLEGTIGRLSVRWVNPWLAVHEWERKLAQLSLAAECGLQVPSTLVTSDAVQLRRFTAERPAVAKAISQGFLSADGTVESVYTHAASAGRLFDDQSAGLCPTLLQERVEKVADIRLTVIGKARFAARLDADLPDGLDWRRPGTDIRYSVAAIPPCVDVAVTAMLGAMGLRYGAFDFALREDKTWVFLEVNPAGEFAWIEDKLGLPLRDALIDELLGLETKYGNRASLSHR